MSREHLSHTKIDWPYPVRKTWTGIACTVPNNTLSLPNSSPVLHFLIKVEWILIFKESARDSNIRIKIVFKIGIKTQRPIAHWYGSLLSLETRTPVQGNQDSKKLMLVTWWKVIEIM